MISRRRGAADRREQAVGRIGQPVQVEAAGDRRVDGHGDHRGDSGWPHPAREPPRRSDDGTHGDADDGEPRQGALVRLGGPAEDGQEGKGPPHGGGPTDGSAKARPATTR